ncbi:DUF6506 family protein [Rosenbergiella metrosideri]|uniref:DUF6506 family protein n=1 Tax=Rosenbergiella metrosideri TaxID=2921185 RepID=UPI001F4F3304|nr:DUF6506 family protein [Rosenbergiella metrosideri]
MTIFKAAFIFIAPEASPSTDFTWIKTKNVHLKTVGVKTYKEACELLDTLHSEGIQAVELCAGFGNQGVSEVTKASAGRLNIGVVRFDNHPCLNNTSGDSLFNK